MVCRCAGRGYGGMSNATVDLTDDEFEQLVEAAVLAPSADNVHVLRFERAGSRIRLWGDSRFASTLEPVRFLHLLSFGAVVENMKLRAMRLGFDMHACWFANDREPRLIAEVDLARKAEGRSDPLEDALPERQTNRRVLFRGPSMSPDERELIAREVDAVANVQLTWFDSSEARNQILRLIKIAETERFTSRLLHAELYSAVRFDVGWTATASEGLPPGALEVEPPMRRIFAELRHWPLLRLLNLLGAHHLLGFRAGYLPCRLAPHVGALTTSLDSRSGAVAAGAAFERVWLRATALGLSLQPLAASAALRMPNYPGVSARTRERLLEGWQRIAPERTPLMVFRIGRARPPSVRTGRRPLEAYVLHGPLSPRPARENL
jgi:hypothetical protein